MGLLLPAVVKLPDFIRKGVTLLREGAWFRIVAKGLSCFKNTSFPGTGTGAVDDSWLNACSDRGGRTPVPKGQTDQPRSDPFCPFGAEDIHNSHHEPTTAPDQNLCDVSDHQATSTLSISARCLISSAMLR